MILTRLIKNVLHRPSGPADGDVAKSATRTPAPTGEPIVLNVGGSSKQIPIPDHYRGWYHYLLDIADGADVDVVLDARKLAQFDAEQFDAIYCSHNLEHYFPHDGAKVLAGFLHVLKPTGFAEIAVPDMQAVLTAMVSRGMDIEDVLYTSPAGPITVHDVIYGWGKEIERSGVDFFAHKRGFTTTTLAAALKSAGFVQVVIGSNPAGYEIRALAFKSPPTLQQRALFGIPD